MLKNTLIASRIFLSAILMMFVLNSCEQLGVTEPESINSINDDYSSYSFYAEIPSLSADGIGTEATISSQMELSADMPYSMKLDDKSGKKGDDKGGKKGDDKGGKKGDDKGGKKGDKNIDNPHKTPMPNGPFQKIFAKMKLDSLQKEAIKILIDSHRSCEKDAVTALKAAQLPFIQTGNEMRNSILTSLKAGEITKEEAKAQLTELNASIRALMEADPAVQAALAQLKNCFDTLLASIREVLTPEQQILWDEFVAKLATKTTPIKK